MRVGRAAGLVGGLQRRCDHGQHGIEVVEVRPVTAQGHLDDPRVVDPRPVERGVARVEGVELLHLALLGVQLEHRLVQQRVEPAVPHGGDHAVDPVVDVGHDVGWRAEDGLGDPPGPPGRHPALQDPGPGAGEPVLEHQGVPDQRLAGGRGHPARGREGGGGVPPHRRDPEPLGVDPLPAVDLVQVDASRCRCLQPLEVQTAVVVGGARPGPDGDPPARHGPVRVGGVGVGPGHGQHQQVDAGTLLCVVRLPHQGEQVGRGRHLAGDALLPRGDRGGGPLVRRGGEGHECIVLEQVFESQGERVNSIDVVRPS